MEKTVTVNEVLSAYRSLSRLAQDQTRDRAIALRIAQNLRVIEQEAKLIETFREEIRKEHPEIQTVTAGEQQILTAIPEGWDYENPDNNSDELKKLQASIWAEYASKLMDYHDTEITVVLRGFRKKDIPNSVRALDLVQLSWMIEDFENLDFDDEETELK